MMLLILYNFMEQSLLVEQQQWQNIRGGIKSSTYGDGSRNNSSKSRSNIGGGIKSCIYSDGGRNNSSNSSGSRNCIITITSQWLKL